MQVAVRHSAFSILADERDGKRSCKIDSSESGHTSVSIIYSILDLVTLDQPPAAARLAQPTHESARAVVPNRLPFLQPTPLSPEKAHQQPLLLTRHATKRGRQLDPRLLVWRKRSSAELILVCLRVCEPHSEPFTGETHRSCRRIGKASALLCCASACWAKHMMYQAFAMGERCWGARRGRRTRGGEAAACPVAGAACFCLLVYTLAKPVAAQSIGRLPLAASIRGTQAGRQRTLDQERCQTPRPLFAPVPGTAVVLRTYSSV